MNRLKSFLQQNDNKVKLVSFDLFDTIVTRRFGQPKDLFFELERRLTQKNKKYKGLANERTKAELELRRKYSFKREVTLEEIYEFLPQFFDLDKLELTNIKKTELELEEESIVPIPSLVTTIEELKNTKRIIIISDTYFPETFIHNILKRLVLDKLFDRIYLSSTYRDLKSTGDLFSLVKKEEKIKERNWIHIGDNKESDYDIPRKKNIRAFWFEESLINRYEQVFCKENNYNFQISKFASLMKQIRLENPYNDLRKKTIWDSTINVSGPLIISYVMWCLEKAKELGLNRLYFLARDGQVMHKIAKILCQYLNYPIECHYLYVSRQALLFPAIQKLDDESLEWVLAPTSIVTPRIILKRINIGPEEIKGVLLKHGYHNPDTKIPGKSLHRFKSVLEDDKVNEMIKTKVITYREDIYGYLKQEGLTRDGEFAVVDIGWSGTLQRSISRLLGFYGHDSPVNGLYFGLNRRFKHKKSDILEAYYYSPENSKSLKNETYIIPMIEVFVCADHGGVIRYKPEGSSYIPVLKYEKNVKTMNWGIEAQQQAMVRLAERMAKEKIIDNDILMEGLFKNFRNFIIDPSRREAEAYGAYMDAEDQNESYFMPLAKKYNLVELFLHYKHGYMHHHNEWKEAARKLSNSFTTLLLNGKSKKI